MKRLEELDILKGILIILVVIGHTNTMFTKYIYWFHMPAFFIISGFLYKKPELNNIKNFLSKKATALLIPYIVFLILVTLIAIPFGFVEFDFKFILKVLIGGKMLFGVLGVFWFVPSLFLTMVIYTYGLYFFRDTLKFSLFVFCCFILANIESYLIFNKHYNIIFPYNIDSSILGIVYFFLGQQLKHYYYKIEKANFKQILVIFSLTIIACYYVVFIHEINFKFDMKYQLYGMFVYNLIIPFLFTLMFWFFSLICSRVLVFKLPLMEIGKSSLLIMYLHLLIKDILTLFSIYSLSSLLFISIILSVFLNRTLIMNKYTSLLFLGNYKKTL